MRQTVLALLACLWAVPAACQCEDEANAVRTRAWNSGPFHFETTRWSKDLRTRVCGEIVPDVAQRERSCDAVAGAEPDTVWIGDRRWERDSFGWRGPNPMIWTHQDRMPVPGAPFSAKQAICSGPAVIDGRATNKYEFVKEIGDWVWVETIFADKESGIPIRFETRGRNGADAGAITIYRHDPSIRIDPPIVDLDKRWSASLQRLSEEARKGDPACREAFLAAVQRGEMAAFDFVIKGSFESGYGVAGIFVPSDAIHYWLASSAFGTIEETIAAGGRAWAKRARAWTEAPGLQDSVKKVITSLFPRPEDIGQVKCSGNVSMDGRDHDAYHYDAYRDSESAKTLYSHRSMLVEKASGTPVRNVSVSRTNAPQWVETRRYDSTLTIQTPPPESIQAPRIVGPPLVSAPPEVSRRPTVPNWLPFGLGREDAYWPPSGPNWPPFISTPPAEGNWPPQ